MQLLSKNGATGRNKVPSFSVAMVSSKCQFTYLRHRCGWHYHEWVHNFLSNPMVLGQGFGKKTSSLVHAIAHSLLEALLWWQPAIGISASEHQKRCSEAPLPKTEAIIGSVAYKHRKRFPDQFWQAHFRDA